MIANRIEDTPAHDDTSCSGACTKSSKRG